MSVTPLQLAILAKQPEVRERSLLDDSTHCEKHYLQAVEFLLNRPLKFREETLLNMLKAVTIVRFQGKITYYTREDQVSHNCFLKQVSWFTTSQERLRSSIIMSMIWFSKIDATVIVNLAHAFSSF